MKEELDLKMKFGLRDPGPLFYQKPKWSRQ